MSCDIKAFDSVVDVLYIRQYEFVLDIISMPSFFHIFFADWKCVPYFCALIQTYSDYIDSEGCYTDFKTSIF